MLLLQKLRLSLLLILFVLVLRLLLVMSSLQIILLVVLLTMLHLPCLFLLLLLVIVLLLLLLPPLVFDIPSSSCNYYVFLFLLSFFLAFLLVSADMSCSVFVVAIIESIQLAATGESRANILPNKGNMKTI